MGGAGPSARFLPLRDRRGGGGGGGGRSRSIRAVPPSARSAGGGMGVVASSQESAGTRRAEPVLITDAQPSLFDEHAARKKRYVLTMGVRALSLVLATVVYTATHILWLVLL